MTSLVYGSGPPQVLVSGSLFRGPLPDRGNWAGAFALAQLSSALENSGEVPADTPRASCREALRWKVGFPCLRNLLRRDHLLLRLVWLRGKGGASLSTAQAEHPSGRAGRRGAAVISQGCCGPAPGPKSFSSALLSGLGDA